VIDSPARRVLVRGGALFPEPAPAKLLGASAGGGLIKVGWIGIGLRMELLQDRRCIGSSPVQSISVHPPGSPSATVDERG
jgi:hypothetical protein